MVPHDVMEAMQGYQMQCETDPDLWIQSATEGAHGRFSSPAAKIKCMMTPFRARLPVG